MRSRTQQRSKRSTRVNSRFSAVVDRASRLPFLIAVALIAAALGDALVESISNSGALGSGYADNNHLSIIPALIAGASLVAFLILTRCVALLRSGFAHSEPSHADLPFVLMLQFGSLFVMESCEQLCFGGRLLGGTAWLGGPVWFSVLTHILLGSLCMLLVACTMRVIVKRCVVLVAIALEFMLDAVARVNCGSFASRQHESRFLCNQNLRVHQIGGRAPPLVLLALT